VNPAAGQSSPSFPVLRAAGRSLVLDARGTGLPGVLHWGADLGDLGEADLEALAAASVPAVARSSYDVAVPLSLLPEQSEGYVGRPALSGSRGGAAWTARFATTSVRCSDTDVVVSAVDETAALAVELRLTLDPAGVLRVCHELTNTGESDYTLEGLHVALPVPARATELLDLTGRWSRERSPQRHCLPLGCWSRESRHGRPGHDATLLLLAGTPGFGFRSGSVWGLHVAWSGNSVSWAERSPTGTGLLGGGELLLPGEVVLAPGESYRTPEVVAVHSDSGLDAASASLHAMLRARPQHPHRPRPVVLNTWEAVYFDHDLDRLRQLADVAAEVGVERYVLDDGWFRRRRNDSAGLGDWYVDDEVWPQGLGPLIEHVQGLGMEFGLWVEPEMVNENSDLYREHPDWALATGGRLPLPWRRQHVLDLANPAVYAYLLERLDALLTAYDIDFLKWDHNRDLTGAGRPDGRPAVRAQTLALYRLLDDLRARHPGVEVESCASGGARVDLGILARTDRVWASDTNDALERQPLQLWTSLLLPLELIGSHIGPTRSHTTGRTHDLSFRAVTALFGSFGMEWDISTTDPEQRAQLRGAIAAYRRYRGLLHRGQVVRSDSPGEGALVHGVVAPDRSEALFAYVQLASAPALPGRLVLPGLADDRRYRVRPDYSAGMPGLQQAAPPPWLAAGEVVLPGRVLGQAGLAVPVLLPEQALLLHLFSA